MQRVQRGLSRLLAIGAVTTALAMAGPVTLGAQVRVVGTTIEHESREAIPYVNVSILDDDDEVLANMVSDEHGTFAFSIPEKGRISLKGERIGYETVVTPSLRVDRFRSMRVELSMSPRAVPVAPLEVVLHVPRRTSPFHTEFEHRRKLGLGDYISRDDFRSQSPAYVTDILRRIPGLQIAQSGQGRNSMLFTTRSSSMRGRCPMQIWIDGFHVNRLDGWTFRIDDVVTPDDVFGIEVYKGISTVPPEFLSPESDCGVVAIWTRRG